MTLIGVQIGVPGNAAGGSGTSSAQEQASRRVTRMCLTIAATFSVAWLPYQITRIVMVYGNLPHAALIINAARSLSYVNSCVNPIVYALMWRPFRLSLIQVGVIRPGSCAGCCDEHVCLSVCPRAYLANRTSERHQIFHACLHVAVGRSSSGGAVIC